MVSQGMAHYDEEGVIQFREVRVYSQSCSHYGWSGNKKFTVEPFRASPVVGLSVQLPVHK